MAVRASFTDEVKAELDLVLRLQERRTDKDVAMVRLHDELGLPSFQSVFGPWLTAPNLPRLQKLLQSVEKEGKVQARAAKEHFGRPRPAAVDLRVKPVIEETNNGYPSGHAMRGQLFAVILSELAPDKKSDLLARGQEVGWSRVVGGVHFPSDVTAGRFLAQAMAHELFANPAFRAELELVKKEFNEARKRK